MPTSTEITAAVRGAFRLLMFDPSGLKAFDYSIEGFWRSFYAALLVAPIYFAAVVIQHDLALALIAAGVLQAAGDVPGLRATLLAEAVAYPLGWILFPVAMIGIARLLRVTGRYVPYIVTYNWSSVITTGLQLLPLALYASGIVGAKMAAAPIFFFLIVGITYRWYIARVALGVTGSIALALVFIDLLISLLLARAAAFLFG